MMYGSAYGSCRVLPFRETSMRRSSMLKVGIAALRPNSTRFCRGVYTASEAASEGRSLIPFQVTPEQGPMAHPWTT